MSFSNGPAIITNGLALAVDASDRNSYPGSGTTCSDISGNGYSGTLLNGVGYNSGNGGYFEFTNTDDYINMGNVSLSSTALSCCAWVYDTSPNNNAPTRFIAFKSGYFIFRCEDVSGDLASFVNAGGVIEPRIQTPLTKNVWNHVAFTWNTSGTHRLFVNGEVKVSSTTRSGNTSSNNNNFLIVEPNNEWIGRIAQVQMYNATLSDAQILQNYNATKSRFGLK